MNESLAPIYIISGDEPLLVQESCDLIRNNLKTRGFGDRELFHVEASFDWSQVLFSANSMSLFAEQKFIELRIPNGKPGDKGNKALMTYLQAIPADTIMLIVLPKLDASTQRTKWYKALEAASVVVQVWPIDANQLPRWVAQRFRQVGLKASRDAIQALIERIEGNLLAAAQEIDRLRLSVDGDQIDLQQVLDAVTENARYDVFGLIDAATGQNPDRAIKIIRGLRSENAEILFILAMLGRELRTLISMARAVAEGQKIDGVLQKNRVWSKRKSIVGRCLKGRSVTVLETCLRQLSCVDGQLKGVRPGQPWDQLENILLQLAGRPLLVANLA